LLSTIERKAYLAHTPGRAIRPSTKVALPGESPEHQHRGTMTRRAVLIGLVSAGLVGFDVTAIRAQEAVRLTGSVQWLAGATMQLMTAGGTVAIDLRQADQDSYRGLRTGERVVVDGVVSNDRRAVIAFEIWRHGDAIESP
jgi:hypothetical protein